MKLTVTPAAVHCFVQEWDFRKGDRIRIFVRYVSGGEEPFAFGITPDEPVQAALSTVADDLTFFMEEKDIWFLENRDLTLDAREDMILFQMSSEH
ncbi:hypothetical protein J31TS4_04350 [Paenibacillus sp. J31TS4]|uniref:HesB/YadR/YfhF family protein n=1 Tax=Paenibacillus sp. J31TS4 TaxID=2807195 RepID=UPI001B16246F|nr:Fe-S cluster assembly protein HesB [Paenibacillus sp. J31TS4]GIP37155.1 hypothetical protein J31TS4_04350 [Paenibacillus sp. J31TS4]